jgi:aldehyde:ferredoxin oxidoreductase
MSYSSNGNGTLSLTNISHNHSHWILKYTSQVSSLQVSKLRGIVFNFRIQEWRLGTFSCPKKCHKVFENKSKKGGATDTQERDLVPILRLLITGLSLCFP